ncbi:MAG: C45 family autoproteolytic acyltransferase/hydrolase [Planctomycetota bacterium]|jgi:hypothetical protein
MKQRLRAAFAVILAAALGACTGQILDGAPDRRAARSPASRGSELHGRIERHDGLRVLRLWGTPEQRGHAHGLLLAGDIATIMRREFAARFASAPELLDQARGAVPRLIEYPDDIARELEALWRGLLEAGVDLDMPALGRAFDKTDLLVANALDVFGLMGCSSFTVWGDQVVGGGVLTARNFDWPLTGEHMLKETLLVVQEHGDGRKVASLAWPGYVGTVTGVSADGVAAYLHVGSAKFSLPEPSSWPSAIAARKVLESDGRGDARLRQAREHLEYTSPPAGFLTHVVLPEVPESGTPAALFETDAHDSVLGAVQPGPFVVTNHFRTREDGRQSSPDSRGREQTLQQGITGCIEVGDEKVDVDEAWRMLASVEAGGGHHFGTLHSLVFRHEPWCFEVRVAEHAEGGIVAAPSGTRRHRLTRAQVFGAR